MLAIVRNIQLKELLHKNQQAKISLREMGEVENTTSDFIVHFLKELVQEYRISANDHQKIFWIPVKEG